ncbi:MAG TPA: hypothetical protein VMU75_09175 [Acidimicrobiales bacterium]|nr:hypothetical protein [Acidimicrobiales bacterium]
MSTEMGASAPTRHTSGTMVPGSTNAGHAWRVWITRHPIGGALVSGFVATHIATVFGIWFHGIGLPDLDWPLANGAVVDPTGSPIVRFAIGEFIHGFDGLVFTLIFALFIFPLIKGPVTPAMNMARALLFGLALATISAGFLVPYVYFPHAGAGIFASGYGWKLVFAIYLWHLGFGVNLGMMYNPLPVDHPDVRQQASA